MGFCGTHRGREFAAFCVHPQKHTDLYPNRYGYTSADVKLPKPKDGVLCLKYGSLRMQDNLVWSYQLLLAKVDRDNKIILWNMNGEGRSPTTTAHLGAIRAAKYMLPDWGYVPIESLTENHDTVAELLNIHPGLVIEDWPEVRRFYMFCRMHIEKLTSFGDSIYDLVDKFTRMNRTEREAMLGLMELATETI